MTVKLGPTAVYAKLAVNKHMKKYLAFYDDHEDCQEVIEAEDDNDAMIKVLKLLGIVITRLPKD